MKLCNYKIMKLACSYEIMQLWNYAIMKSYNSKIMQLWNYEITHVTVEGSAITGPRLHNCATVVRMMEVKHSFGCMKESVVSLPSHKRNIIHSIHLRPHMLKLWVSIVCHKLITPRKRTKLWSVNKWIEHLAKSRRFWVNKHKAQRQAKVANLHQKSLHRNSPKFIRNSYEIQNFSAMGKSGGLTVWRNVLWCRACIFAKNHFTEMHRNSYEIHTKFRTFPK